MIKKCLICNNDFYVPNCNKDRLYCCRDCYTIARNKDRFIMKKCGCCGKLFKTFKTRQKKFCSNICVMEDRRIYGIISKKCDFCGKIYETNKANEPYSHFCSVNCKHDSQRKYEHGIIKCKVCKKEFSGYVHRVYCSMRCQTKAISYGKQCKYKNIILRSTYELRTCNILDKLKEKGTIYNWAYEVMKIPYLDGDNKKHKYNVDFTVYDSNNNCYYIEVKGRMTDWDKFKIDCALKQNYNIKIWFLDDIKNQEQKLNISTDQVKQLLLDGIIRK